MRLSQTIHLATASLVVAMAGVACSLLPSEPYTEVRYYDLGFPPSAGALSDLDVSPLSTDAACKFKMLYRDAGNELMIDEYNKWSQPPGQMLTKYLRLAFRREFQDSVQQSMERRKFTLSGSILSFEADLDAKEVRLGINYSIAEKGLEGLELSRTRIFTESLRKEGSEAVSLAMAKAAAQLVGAIREDLASLESQPQEGKPAAASAEGKP